MRKLIASVASTVALLVASMANAAPVDIAFNQTAPGANTWTLTLNVPTGIDVGSLNFHLTSSPAADLVLNTTVAVIPTIDAFTPTGFSVKIITASDTNLSLVPSGANTTIVPVGSAATYLIGTVTGTFVGCNGGGTNTAGGCASQFVPGESDYGGTILGAIDPATGSAAVHDWTVRFVANNPVPEPGAVLLLGMGIAGLSLIRRKA